MLKAMTETEKPTSTPPQVSISTAEAFAEFQTSFERTVAQSPDENLEPDVALFKDGARPTEELLCKCHAIALY